MIAFLDIEASGLHPTSFPLEVAWVSQDLTQGWAAIIRPDAAWTLLDWSAEAEAVHHLSYGQCEIGGRLASEVAARLNADLRGATVLTDSPPTDTRWLRRLFDASGLEPAFPLGEVDALLTSTCERAGVTALDQERRTASLAAELGLQPHHALDDALRHALAMASVAISQIERDHGAGAAADFRTGLMARANLLLARHGRVARRKG